MGCALSKTRNQHPCPLYYNSDLYSGIQIYRKACRVDPKAQSLDSKFLKSMSGVLGILHVGNNNSLSLPSLLDLIDCLVQPEQELLKVLPQLGVEEIWNQSDLYELAMDYYAHCIHALRFCHDLTGCFDIARKHLVEIEQEFLKFEWSLGERRKSYGTILQHLKKFKTDHGKQFTTHFSVSLKNFYESLNSHSKILLAKKIKLDKKYGKKIKSWKSLSNVTFVAAFASLLVCSVLATAIAAPPPLMTAVAATMQTSSTGNLGDWINVLRNELKGHRNRMSTSDFWTCIGNCDLDNIWVLVDKWEFEIESRLKNGEEFGIEDEAALMLTMDEMKKVVSVFLETIRNLTDRAEDWRNAITEERLEFKRVTSHLD